MTTVGAAQPWVSLEFRDDGSKRIFPGVILVFTFPLQDNLMSLLFRFLVLLGAVSVCLAQPGDGITDVSPATAAQGDTNVLVTITLDSELAPPSMVNPSKVTIGALEDNSPGRSNLEVTATFNIPASATLGLFDVSVTFPGPMGDIVFTESDGFEITIHPDCIGLSLSANSDSFSALGGNGSFDVMADGGCAWTAVSNRSWLTMTSSTSGSGNAQIDFSVDQLFSPLPRSGDIQILDQVFHVEQSGDGSLDIGFPVIDTAQDTCYDTNGNVITCPDSLDPLYGQDAQYFGTQPSYTDHGDQTVTDNRTGIMWTKAPAVDKLTIVDAISYCDALSLAGFEDWRLPSIKELLSLADFRGELLGDDTSSATPYINTDYFEFTYDDEVSFNGQYWSSTEYVKGPTVDTQLAYFGFNFADGHIKAYPSGFSFENPMQPDGPAAEQFVMCMRCTEQNLGAGSLSYGANLFVDNGDNTITDVYTGLVWQADDDGTTRDWPGALDYCEDLVLAGRSDWRLPNGKELQSIVDYEKLEIPAIDPIFGTTEAESWFWTSTTHGDNKSYGVYIAFGKAYSRADEFSDYSDWHGAGALRSDPKEGDPADFELCSTNACDEVRILNYVRCVTDYSSQGCSVGLDTSSDTLPAQAGSATFDVTAGTGCVWQATSNDAWITVNNGPHFSGNGTVSYSVSENTSLDNRDGTITTSGGDFTVTQDGITCVYALGSESVAYDAGAQSGSFQLNTQSPCPWTATTTDEFIWIQEPSSGTGSATISYTIEENQDLGTRVGDIQVGGQTFTITQNGIVCAFSLSAASVNVPSTGDTGSFDITTQDPCQWTAVSNDDWLQVTAGASGEGNGTVSYSVEPNLDTNARTSTITAGGETFTVIQAGTCPFVLSPTISNFDHEGGSDGFTIATDPGCAWNAQSNSNWVTISSAGSGTGSGQLNFEVSTNPTVNTRQAEISVESAVHTVIQSGCSSDLLTMITSWPTTGVEALVTEVDRCSF